jgi:methionyl-tRNA formyltransferase
MKPGIVFMGTPEFAVPALRRLAEDGYPILAVVCQPDKPIGRHQVMTAPPVKQAAQELGLLVLQPEKIRTGELMAQLRSLSPDLIVTAAYGRILPREILDIRPMAALISTAPAARLPRRRPGSALYYRWLPGNRHYHHGMDEGMDTARSCFRKKCRCR